MLEEYGLEYGHPSQVGDHGVYFLTQKNDGHVGGIVAWLGKGRFDAVDRKIDRLESRLDGRIDSLGARLDGRIDTLQSSMDAMRSDLTQVALAVGVRLRAQND